MAKSKKSLLLISLGVILLHLLFNQPVLADDKPLPAATASAPVGTEAGGQAVYIPVINRGREQLSWPVLPGTSDIPLLHLPYFQSKISFDQTAIFWFGRVTATQNYADVRLAYTGELLYVHLSVFDSTLMYDTRPSASDLDAWDGATLYLVTGDGQSGEVQYRFTAQLHNYNDAQAPYELAEQRQEGSWERASLPFSTKDVWRGAGLNDNRMTDRGWMMTYYIPFSSLGLSTPPAQGSIWRLGVVLHDRDASDGGASHTPWPENFSESQPGSWGRLSFGWPAASPPAGVPDGSATIRYEPNSPGVIDATVGGGTVCGSGLEFWTEWGEKSYPGEGQINIQNQYDVADWPCFSKMYITFPLARVPGGKVILSAKLTLHQFGGSGGGEWGAPPDSVIQVMTIRKDWSEELLTWNNAPQVSENISQALVRGLVSFPGWPGVPVTWDVTRAAAQAYALGIPLHLAVYSADDEMHSGKYFVSSEAEGWNKAARPRLDVVWGNP